MNENKVINKITFDFVNKVLRPSDLMGMLIALFEMSNRHAEVLAKSINDENDTDSAQLLMDVSTVLDKFNEFGREKVLKTVKQNMN